MYRPIVLAAFVAVLAALVGDVRSGAPRAAVNPEQAICQSSAASQAR